MFYSRVDLYRLGATVGKPSKGRWVNRVPNAEGGESWSEGDEGEKSSPEVSNGVRLKPPRQATGTEYPAGYFQGERPQRFVQSVEGDE